MIALNIQMEDILSWEEQMTLPLHTTEVVLPANLIHLIISDLIQGIMILSFCSLPQAVLSMHVFGPHCFKLSDHKSRAEQSVGGPTLLTLEGPRLAQVTSGKLDNGNMTTMTTQVRVEEEYEDMQCWIGSFSSYLFADIQVASGSPGYIPPLCL